MASLNLSGKYPADKLALNISFSVLLHFWGSFLVKFCLFHCFPDKIFLIFFMWLMSYVVISCVRKLGSTLSLVKSALSKGEILSMFWLR